MKIIDRYLGRAVLQGSLLAFLVLISLAAFFTFIDELGDLKGDYTVLKAFEYVFFVLPRKGYELFHTSILLGSLMSLGSMASNSELLVLRAAGMSIARITWSVLKAGLLLMLLGAILGEIVAPPAEQHAQKLRMTAITGSTAIQNGQGIWSKNKQNFIRVGKVFPDARIADIVIYSFDEKRKLSAIIKAERATYTSSLWRMRDVTETRFADQSFTQQRHAQLDWVALLQPEMLDTLTVNEQNLSMLSLFRYMQYLQSNQLDASKYELAFWMKLVKPFSALIMLLIAMPFVFGSLRSSSIGQRLLVGVLLGLGFHMFNQALNYIGVGYGLNAVVSAMLPSLIFAAGGFWALKKVY
jgi:lipopolysaccharide export system permease protein